MPMILSKTKRMRTRHHTISSISIKIFFDRLFTFDLFGFISSKQSALHQPPTRYQNSPTSPLLHICCLFIQMKMNSNNPNSTLILQISLRKQVTKPYKKANTGDEEEAGRGAERLQDGCSAAPRGDEASCKPIAAFSKVTGSSGRFGKELFSWVFSSLPFYFL